MKAVILAGGLGTRLSEETHLKPKPMVEIWNRPILWHILKIYSFYGVKEFIICCGYKGYLIKEYFSNYFLHDSDVTFHIGSKKESYDVHERGKDEWKITLINTGENTNTAGRLKMVRKYLNSNEAFFFNYGDGVGDVNLKKLVELHKLNQKKVTLTAVQPPARFGALDLDGDSVIRFKEKPTGDNSWINGGFFVVEPSVLDQINNDECSWEQEVLPDLAQRNQLSAKYSGFWHPMDTLRDRNKLDELWRSGKAKWKLWK